MPQMDPQKFYNVIEKALEDQKFPPVIFLFGDEPYLVQQAFQYVKVCALHGGAADFNLTSYFASDSEISTVLDECETLPMMSNRRVVVLREAQDLSDREWTQLEAYFNNPVDTTVFLLVGGKIDKRKKSYRGVLENTLNVEFRKPFENQVPGWIRHICKGHGLEISDEAVQLLFRLVGSQLIEIEAEVKKLKDYLNTRTQVEFEDVAQVVSQKKEESVFDFVDALASGDRAQAMLLLVQLIDQGQNEIGVISLSARHIRALLLLKQGQNMGMAGQKLAQYAQVPSYFINDYLRQSRIWSVRKLEQMLLIFADTDKALKSSPVSSHIWLENMVMKVCGLKPQPENSGTPLSFT